MAAASSRPRVSVVIPTYNSARYVRGAVDSVLGQRWRDFEVIVVDDGSDAENARLLDEIAAGEDAVRVLHQENQGPARARRHGWEAAKGDWVAFLDDDDRYLEGYLEACQGYLEQHPEHDAVYTRYRYVTEEGAFAEERALPKHGPTGRIFVDEVRKTAVKTSTLMVRRECLLGLTGLCEHLKRAENYDMVLRLAYRHSFGFIEDVLVEVTKRSGSLSRPATKRTFENRAEVLESALASFPDMEPRDRRVVVAKLAQYWLKTGERLTQSGQREEGAESLRKALGYRWSTRAWAGFLRNRLGL